MARYIDAEKATDYFEKHRRIAIHKDDIIAYIADQSTEEVAKVRRGRYVEDGYEVVGNDIPIVCDQCGSEIPYKTAHHVLNKRYEIRYCYFCGARMET